MKHGRPYPPDKERRVRVKTELALRDMSVSDLSKGLKMNQGYLSLVINGIRRSRKAEEKIAAFFGKGLEELFPRRSKTELAAMRKAAGGAA